MKEHPFIPVPQLPSFTLSKATSVSTFHNIQVMLRIYKQINTDMSPFFYINSSMLYNLLVLHLAFLLHSIFCLSFPINIAA